jgi:hypothetical protein
LTSEDKIPTRLEGLGRQEARSAAKDCAPNSGVTSHIDMKMTLSVHSIRFKISLASS